MSHIMTVTHQHSLDKVNRPGMPRSRPTTPVRRVSRGSISSHHRASLSGGTAAGNSVGAGAGQGTTPLSFLTQAMGDLAYETATLQSNLEAIDEIQGALHTFDESFSMFLYGLKMNAFCVEWPEAPGEENFDRAEMRKGERGRSICSTYSKADQQMPSSCDSTNARLYPARPTRLVCAYDR